MLKKRNSKSRALRLPHVSLPNPPVHRTHENPQMWYVAGRTGHTEVVRVVFHPDKVSFANLLKVFWENHDPTQGTAL